MIYIVHQAADIPPQELFDNRTNEFISIPGRHVDDMDLRLEHSLMSVAKWEGIWHESFSEQEKLPPEKLISYIRCMTINTQRNPDIYDQLTREDRNRILAYMNDPKSAWVIKKPEKKPRRKQPQTAEEIYWAMIQYGIPMECEKWHFNRLIALLDYCKEKGSHSGYGGQKKKSEREIMEMYRALNEKNRKRFNSKG